MAVSARIVSAAAFSLAIAGAAMAEQAQPAAAPADRCEGTLCDLYYASRPNVPEAGPAKPVATAPGIPAGATALTVPSGNPLSRLFGGGGSSSGGSSAGSSAEARLPVPESEPASASNSYMHLGGGGILGSRNEPCSGTLCDVYHGFSPAEPSAGQQQASAAGEAAPVEPPVPHRHIVHESETRPKCSSPAADPWRCFR